MHPLLARLRLVCEHSLPGTLIPVESLRELLAGEGQESASVQGEADLTVEQVAGKLGRAPSTVRDWIRADRLRAYKMRGREWRVTREALEEFLESERRRDEPPPPRGKPPRLDAWRDHMPAA